MNTKRTPALWLAFLAGVPAAVLAQTSPEKPMQSLPPNYIIETARQPDKIQREYPHDIQLRTVSGDTVLSSTVLPRGKGRPVVLLFWLTTCGPCRMELDAFKQQYAAWQEETPFDLVAISTDFPRNYPAFETRVTTEKWPWPAYIDLNREFGKILPGELNGLPQTFILDAEGTIRHHKRKFRPGDEVQIYELIKAVAAGN